MYPITDPVSTTGILDRISLAMGLYRQSTVIILDLGNPGSLTYRISQLKCCKFDFSAPYSSTIYAYTFQRRISDGTFRIASEEKVMILPGLFTKADAIPIRQFSNDIETRVEEVASAAEKATLPPSKSPILVRISPDVLDRVAFSGVTGEEVAKVLAVVGGRLKNSTVLEYSDPDATDREGGISLGTLGKREVRLLQWFAINLLTHRLDTGGGTFSVGRTAVIVDLASNDLEITLALGSGRKDLLRERASSPPSRLSAFSRSVKLVTLTYKGLGLVPARVAMLLKDQDSDRNSTESKKSDGVTADPVEVRSECMNPIAQAIWTYDGRQSTMQQY